MPTKTMEDLFFDGVKDIYYAERKIVAALKKMIRGAKSDLLAEKTLEDMAGRHPDCETYTAPGQGHAPLLGTKDMIRRIAKLVARAERRAG